MIDHTFVRLSQDSQFFLKIMDRHGVECEIPIDSFPLFELECSTQTYQFEVKNVLLRAVGIIVETPDEEPKSITFEGTGAALWLRSILTKEMEQYKAYLGHLLRKDR